MNIVVLDAYVNNPGDLSWEPLKQFGTVTLYDRTSADEVATRAADADIAVTNKVAWDAAALDACPNLKLIASPQRASTLSTSKRRGSAA